MNELIPAEQGNPLKDCKGINMDMALTYVPEDNRVWSAITTGPWFLDYARKAKWPECGSFGDKFKGLTAKALDGLVTTALYTPIDLFSLFDKVIIHELTPTRSGGQTKDVKMDPHGPDGITNAAYGFKRCEAISGRVVGIGGSTADAVPHSNADTFALFASGVRIINNGSSVDNSGKITKPTNRKR